MGFTDGFRQTRPGARIASAREAYALDLNGGALRVIAPTRVVASRGDTLNPATLTVDVEPWAPDARRTGGPAGHGPPRRPRAADRQDDREQAT